MNLLISSGLSLVGIGILCLLGASLLFFYKLGVDCVRHKEYSDGFFMFSIVIIGVGVAIYCVGLVIK